MNGSIWDAPRDGAAPVHPVSGPNLTPGARAIAYEADAVSHMYLVPAVAARIRSTLPGPFTPARRPRTVSATS